MSEAELWEATQPKIRDTSAVQIQITVEAAKIGSYPNTRRILIQSEIKLTFKVSHCIIGFIVIDLYTA